MPFKKCSNYPMILFKMYIGTRLLKLLEKTGLLKKNKPKNHHLRKAITDPEKKAQMVNLVPMSLIKCCTVNRWNYSFSLSRHLDRQP